MANRQLENSQWTQLHSKNTDLLFKKSQSSKFKEKTDGFKALWISRTIYDWHFLLKSTQFEKTGSIGIFFREVCIPFNKGNDWIQEEIKSQTAKP